MVDYILAACRGIRTYSSPEETEEETEVDPRIAAVIKEFELIHPEFCPPPGYVSRKSSEMADLWVPEELSVGEILTAKFRLESTIEGRTDEAYRLFGASQFGKGRLGRIMDGIEVTGLVTEFREIYLEDVRIYKIEIIPEDKMPLHRLTAFEDYEKSLDSEVGLEKGLFHWGFGRDSTGLCLYLERGGDLLIERHIDIFPTMSIDDGGLDKLIIRGVIKDGTKDL
jgi:hypothetical protein